MSYILEALKKSEQKRQKGSVPNLGTVHDPDLILKKSKRHWPYLLIIVLCANAIFLAVLLKQRSQNELSPDRQAAEIQMTSEPIESHNKIPDVPLESLDVHQTVPEKNQPETSRIRAVKTVQTRIGLPSTSTNSKKISALNATEEITSEKMRSVSTTMPHPAELNVPDAALAADDQTTIKSVKLHDVTSVQVNMNSNASPPADDFSISQKRDEMDSEQRIPQIDSLPDSIRQQLPAIAISFHSYTHKPSSRIVSINGRIMREGQSVADGLQLEEITKEGIILRYEGKRFRVSVF